MRCGHIVEGRKCLRTVSGRSKYCWQHKRQKGGGKIRCQRKGSRVKCNEGSGLVNCSDKSDPNRRYRFHECYLIPGIDEYNCDNVTNNPRDPVYYCEDSVVPSKPGQYLYPNGLVSLALIAEISPLSETFKRLEQRRQLLMGSNMVERGEHHITLYTMVFNHGHPATHSLLNDKEFINIVKESYKQHFKNRGFYSNYGEYGIFGSFLVRKYEIVAGNRLMRPETINKFRKDLRDYIISKYGSVSLVGQRQNFRGTNHYVYQLNGTDFYAIPEYDHGDNYKPHVSLININDLSNSLDPVIRNVKNLVAPVTPMDVNNPPNNQLSVLVNKIHNSSEMFPLDPVSSIMPSDIKKLLFSVRVFPKHLSAGYKSKTIKL